jgi:hypothetical protein
MVAAVLSFIVPEKSIIKKGAESNVSAAKRRRSANHPQINKTY